MPECSHAVGREKGALETSCSRQGLQLGQECVGTGQKLHLGSLIFPAVTFSDFLKLIYKYNVDNTQRGGKENKTLPEKSYPDSLQE